MALFRFRTRSLSVTAGPMAPGCSGCINRSQTSALKSSASETGCATAMKR